MIHLDTTFVVDLLRESAKASDGPATRYLATIADERLCLSVHVACELFAGADLAASPRRERARVQELCDLTGVAYPDDRFAPAYGRLLAHLQRRGESIATMDLLIAAAAIVDEAQLVTRNRRHFERVPGLEILSY